MSSQTENYGFQLVGSRVINYSGQDLVNVRMAHDANAYKMDAELRAVNDAIALLGGGGNGAIDGGTF